MSTMAFQISGVSIFVQPFVQSQIKEIIKAPRHWPLCGEFSGGHHVIYSISQEICTRFCFVVVMQSFIMNSHKVFIHIHQGCFAATGAIVRLPQCQWSKPDGYGKISQCITITKHSKAKTVCIFLGIYCITWVIICWQVPYQHQRISPINEDFGLKTWMKYTIFSGKPQ